MAGEYKSQKTKKEKAYRQYVLVSAIVLLAIGGDIWLFYEKNNPSGLTDASVIARQTGTGSVQTQQDDTEAIATLTKKVIPAEGVELPVTWGDLGKQLIGEGVIDQAKFEEIYAKQGGLGDDQKQLLAGSNNGKVRITPDNAPILLNLWWALGLGNKNTILEKGPMTDLKYGGAGKFASTGGWSLSKGDAMTHYSKHTLIVLTPAQQAMVERVSKGIYRPCCDNPTSFPDCNHGMAMLGLLELMAKQGVSENDMYAYALKVNSYWFGNTYLTLAKYFEKQGTPWEQVDPKAVLGKEYSSASGYRQVQTKVDPVQRSGGAGCGV